MSDITVLELRQEDSISGHQRLSNGDYQNGVWETTLDVPIILEAGDQVQVKSVYLDTSIGQSGYIEVPVDIPINMTAAMYINNYNLDQEYEYTGGGAAAVKAPLRQYPNLPDVPPPIPGGATTKARTLKELGDNNKWFLSSLATATADHFIIPNMKMILPDRGKTSRALTYVAGTWTFEFTGTEPGAVRWGKQWSLDVKAFRWNHLDEHNPFKVGVACAANPTDPSVPDFRLIPPGDTVRASLRSTSFDFNTNKIPVPAGGKQATLQEFPLNFILPGGLDVVYTPAEIAKFITDKMNNLEESGRVSTNYFDANHGDNTMTNYPAMTPFLTTILKNDKQMGDQTKEQVFINASGYTESYMDPVEVNQPNGNWNGNFQMTYDIAAMLGEKISNPADKAWTQNALDIWVGTNQIALEYDELANKLKFTQQHFPIYSGDTISSEGKSANDALPSVLFNPATRGNYFQVNEGIATQYSGLVWTQLSPPSFWNQILGFGNIITQPDYSQGFMKTPGNLAVPPPAIPNSFQLETVDGINTTGALKSLDLAVVHSTARYHIPIQAPPVNGDLIIHDTIPVPVETNDVSSLFSSRTWNTAPADDGYFLLDIATNFQQNMVGQGLKTTSTQSIVNRYYTAESFTSDQGAGSIVYEHQGEPQMLSSFKVKVLNPDRTLTAPHVLQPKNTVFIEIIKSQNLGKTNPKKQ